MSVASVGSFWPVFWVFLRLGLTSFGGPVAHLAYFRAALVQRRQWLDERSYADLVALCQFLPGPASSQVGMALGLMRGGWRGALAAWLGFTLPSACALAALGMGFAAGGAQVPAGVVLGLKLVAVAVVAQAVWGMGRSLCATAGRFIMMVLAAGVAVCWPGIGAQLGVMVAAGTLGWWVWGRPVAAAPAPVPQGWALPLSPRQGLLLLVCCGALLACLPWWAAWPGAGRGVAVFDAFFRAGALVFGGGHVVLPLLEAAVVPPGWVAPDAFLAGYGAAQAVPGPLFTFAAFLGGAMAPGWAGAGLAVVAVLGIFLPAGLLVVGALPLWAQLRGRAWARGVLAGVNAAVVGLLLAALYQPVMLSAVHQPWHAGVVLLALVALMRWRLPPVAVVACTVLLTWAVSAGLA